MVKENDLTIVPSPILSDFVRLVTETGDSSKTTITAIKSLIEEGTATPFIEVVDVGDDKGLIFTEQISVGQPSDPKESVFGEGDSYGVGLEDTSPTGTPKPGSAWHATIGNTTGLTIVSATDVTDTFASDSGSTAGLFNGNTTGNYILVGSDYTFGGAKVKITLAGVIESDNVVGEYLQDNSPTWVNAPFMSTDSGFPYTQRGNTLASVIGSEQWRFGFNPIGTVPPVWNKVTLNINGTDYTKYWARFRITNTITTDPTIEQIKLHTNRFEVNNDGNTEYFGISRYKRTLIAGIENLVTNSTNTASSQAVSYETGNCVADYKNNSLNDNVIDSTIVVQNIETGLDTSIPLVLDVSYYVTTATTGNIEWELNVYDVANGFVYDGSATSRNYATIDTIASPSLQVRRTIQMLVPINTLTDDDAIVINIKRDATPGNTDDTLSGNVIITNVRLSGYFWRP